MVHWGWLVITAMIASGIGFSIAELFIGRNR